MLVVHGLGDNAHAFALANLTLHVINTVGGFLLSVKLIGVFQFYLGRSQSQTRLQTQSNFTDWCLCLGSIIQGVHPVRAEAVAWYLALAPSTDN
jgi:hypothetical protein